jgi:outer membrane protein OmpA-like peptidoglycan-associated protein
MGAENFKNPRFDKRTMVIFLSLFCLALSIAVHFLLIQKARRWVILGFSPEHYDTIVPRTFRMNRVEIDPKTLEDEQSPKPQEPRKEVPVILEKETPQIDQNKSTIESQKVLSKPQESLPQEKPDSFLPSSRLDNLMKKAEKDVDQAERVELPIISESPLKLPESQEGKGENSSTRFSSLDDLLAHSGTVRKNTAPILMPTDLLFEYDSDTLKPAAAETLSKLGNLIKKNTKASFRIEGYTDSFGSDDYNKTLSLRRAEAVKIWLRTIMGVDDFQITTVGLGKSKLLVPATGTVEQQQLNRRVEIVISVSK